jgi:anti-sigma factor ChrR (cupin superfamily)
MDCVESVELLSEFQAGGLEEARHVLVAAHLSICSPCMVVFQDVVLIRSTALVLRSEEGITFPDEHVLWQRLNIAHRAPH